MDCCSCIYWVEGERLETICERLKVGKKNKSKEVSQAKRAGGKREVCLEEEEKKSEYLFFFLKMSTVCQQKAHLQAVIKAFKYIPEPL